MRGLKIQYNFWNKESDIIDPEHITKMKKFTAQEIKNQIAKGFHSGVIEKKIDNKQYQIHWYYKKRVYGLQQQ